MLLVCSTNQHASAHGSVSSRDSKKVIFFFFFPEKFQG